MVYVVYVIVIAAVGIALSHYVLFLASVGFMASLVSPARKWLAIYPLVLFYFVLTWLIIIQLPVEKK